MWFKSEYYGYYNSKDVIRFYIKKTDFYYIYAEHNLLSQDICLKDSCKTEEEATEWLCNFIMDLNGK